MPDRPLALGEQVADAALRAGDRRGVRAGRRPALPEDRVRRLRRLAPHRQPEPEQVAQRRRHDVGARLLRRRAHDHAGRAAAGDQVAQQLGELLPDCLLRHASGRTPARRTPPGAAAARPRGAPCAARAPAARDSARPSPRAPPAAARSPPRRPAPRPAARPEPTPRARRACRRAARSAHPDRAPRRASTIDSATDLPAPGSPPISTLRSTSSIATALALLIDPDRDRLPQRQRLRVASRPRHRRRALERIAPHDQHARQRRIPPDRAPPEPRAHAGTPPSCSRRASRSATDCPRRTRTSSTSPAGTRATDHTPGHRNGPAATPESIVARAHARRTRIACSSRSTNRRDRPDREHADATTDDDQPAPTLAEPRAIAR